MVQSEEELALFGVLANIVELLRNAESTQVGLVETLAMARILNALGYFDADFSENLPSELFGNEKASDEQLAVVEKHKTELNREVNKGIQESQV